MDEQQLKDIEDAVRVVVDAKKLRLLESPAVVKVNPTDMKNITVGNPLVVTSMDYRSSTITIRPLKKGEIE